MSAGVGPWQPPANSSLNKAALARLQAEENSRKLVRLANETLRYTSQVVADMMRDYGAIGYSIVCEIKQIYVSTNWVLCLEIHAHVLETLLDGC